MAIPYQKLEKPSCPSISFITILFILSPTVIQASTPETQALLDFKRSLANTEIALSTWVPNSDPCQDRQAHWAGIICYEGVVLGVHLQFMGLSGQINVDALSRLPGLRSIDLEGNRFSGPIPPLNRLGALKSIYLSNNQFSGEIPMDYFSRMGSLKKLWLTSNKFSGEIPLSLAQLPYLIELHLENNQFFGPIPPLRRPPLLSLNLSNNQLDGEIPPSLSKFNASSFDGNPSLCGDILGKSCFPRTPPTTTTAATPTQEEPQRRDQLKNKRSSNLLIAIGITLPVIALCFLIILFLSMKKKKDDNIPTENPRTTNPNNNPTLEVGAVKVEIEPAMVRNDSNNSSRRSSSSISSRKSSRRGGGRGEGDSVGDLTMVNEEKGVFGMTDLMKASAEVLGNGGMGSAYKAVLANGLVLAVKRMKELNRFETKDAFDGEMRKLASLRHDNVLPPLAYHYRQGEKLVVYEYIPKGSLNYLLHGDHERAHLELNWPRRLEIIKGIARGLYYIHSQLNEYELPHGDLKSSNILINSENQPLLSDYGFNTLATPNAAAHSLFGFRSPEAMHSKTVTPKCDVFCLGVVILEILTGKFPSQYLASTKNGTDVVQWVGSAIREEREAGLIDPEMMTKSIGCRMSMVKLLHIGAACTEPNPETRPCLSDVRERIERVEVEEDGGSRSSQDSTRHVRFILPCGTDDNFGVC